MPAPGVGPPAPTGVTSEQSNELMGLQHGLRTAFNPLRETATDVGNWLADRTGIHPSWLPTGDQQRATDAAAEAAFQQQYGSSPAAQGGAVASQVAAPLVAGGAASAGIKALTGLADMPGVGAFLTGSGGAGAPGWSGLATRLLSGGTSGAIQGAIAGGGPGAATGAVVGSTVAPVIGSAADWFNTRFGQGGTLTPALQKIYQALARDDITPAQAEETVAKLGPLATVADVGGPNTKALAGAVANTPGPGAAAAAQALEARGAGQTARLNDAVRTATGATGSAFDNLAALQTERAIQAAPLYDSAFSRIVPTAEEAERVQPFITDPIGQQALQKGLRVIQVEKLAARQPFNPADYGVTEGTDGTFALNPGAPNLRLMDAVKRGYDGIVADNTDPVTHQLNTWGRAVNDARASYVGDLRDMFPRYGSALDAWAGPSADMSALNMGRRILSLDPDVTANAVKGLSDSQKQMFQVGVAQTLQDKIAGTPDDADAVRRLFGNDLIRSRISASFGGESDPAFQAFQQAMERERAFSQTARLLQGSRTAPLSAAMADLNQPAPNLLEPALHAATGNPLMAAMSVGRQAAAPFINRMTSAPEAVNANLGNLLFNPQAQRTLFQNLTPGLAANLRNQLLDWRGQQAAQALINRNRPHGTPPP